MTNTRNPRPPSVSGTALQSRAPKTLVEMQIVIDRVVGELVPAVVTMVSVPLERTVPSDNRGVILTLSESELDLFGQVVEYKVPKVIRSLVHDGQQPFAFTSDAPSTRSVARLVERARRLRVDVFIARTVEQFAELRKQWRV